MIVALNQRVYTTAGEIFSDLKSLRDYNSTYPIRRIKTNLSELQFTINEHIIYLHIEGQHLPFSMAGFKSVCSLLKVPASYLNKSLSDNLILENLNKNPMKVDEPITIYVRQSTDFEFISAVSVYDDALSDKLAEFVENTHFEMNNELTPTDVTISNEEVVVYHLKEKEALSGGQELRRGTAMVFGEGVDLGFSIHPFFRIYFENGDSFDFLGAKAYKKVSRKEKSYMIMVHDEIRHFDLNKYEKNFEDTLKLIEASRKTSDVSFAFLKQIKSAINRTYSFQKGVYDNSHILGQLLPEFESFNEHHKEELKLLPSFEHNNLMLPFYLPKLFSMFEAETTTMENPLFFNRQRRNVYKLLVKNAENYFRN